MTNPIERQYIMSGVKKCFKDFCSWLHFQFIYNLSDWPFGSASGLSEDGHSRKP